MVLETRDYFLDDCLETKITYASTCVEVTMRMHFQFA